MTEYLDQNIIRETHNTTVDTIVDATVHNDKETFNPPRIMNDQIHTVDLLHDSADSHRGSADSQRELDSTDDNKPHDLVFDLYDSQNKKFIPEDDDYGNIEYKRRLDKKDKNGLNTMVMQMMTRMARGHMQNGVWEAHYILGVDDGGEFSMLEKREVIHTSKILRAVVAGAYGKVMSEKIYEFATMDGTPSFVMHVHIKREFKIEQIPESTIYFMGPTGVSKTSILSHLVQGQMDNARGLSRELSLRHAHEKRSGVTSSCKFETIGSNGDTIVNHEISITSDVMEAICAESQILFNLVDLPGDIRYTKTICHSLLTLAPELVILCVPISNPIEYIELHREVYSVIFRVCSMFKTQPLIVFTKSDLIEAEAQADLRRRAMKYLTERLQKLNVDTEEVESIAVNNVKRDGIKELEDYLVSFGNSILDSVDDSNEVDSECDRLLYKVHDVFEVPSIGTVIHGVLIKGVFNTSDLIKVICNGKVMERKILSIHRKAMDVERLNEGETGSIMISGKCDRSILDKTVVITNSDGMSHLSSVGYITSVTGEEIQAKQYVMFVGNNIITVLLEETDLPNYYFFKTHDSTDILIDVEDDYAVPGILRDERKTLTFVRVMPKLPIRTKDQSNENESEIDDIW
jgi:GTPase